MEVLRVWTEGDELHVEVGEDALYREVFTYAAAALGIMYQSYLDESGEDLSFEEFVDDVVTTMRHSANATLAGSVDKIQRDAP